MRVVFVFMNCKRCGTFESALKAHCTTTVGTFIEGANYFSLKANFTQLFYGKIQNATLKTPLFTPVYVLRAWVVPGDTRRRGNWSHRQPWVSASTGNPGPWAAVLITIEPSLQLAESFPPLGFLVPWLCYSLSFLLHSLSFADESVSSPTLSPTLKWTKKWTATLRETDSVRFVSSKSSTWNNKTELLSASKISHNEELTWSPAEPGGTGLLPQLLRRQRQGVSKFKVCLDKLVKHCL